MSQTYCCVLWVPFIFHNFPTPILDKDVPDIIKKELVKQTINIDNVEISDEKGNFSYLDLTLEETQHTDNSAIRSIWIGGRTEKRKGKPAKQELWTGSRSDNDPHYKDNYRWQLRLQCIDARRNGLIQYIYEVPTDFIGKTTNEKHLLLNKEGNITHAVYHAIKSFYHNHKFHEPSDDSIVNPYCYKLNDNKDIIKLDTPNNPALLHYLTQYENKLQKLVKDIDNKVNITYKLYDSKKGKSRVVELSKILLNECSEILGFHVFYNSLYNSKYNLAFKIGGEMHQQAINIENSIEYIKVIKAQFRNFCHLSISSISLNNQEIFREIQQNIEDNIIEVGRIQGKMEGTVSMAVDLQKNMNTSLSDIKEIQKEAADQQVVMNATAVDIKEMQAKGDKISRTNYIASQVYGISSIVFAVFSIVFAIFCYNVSPSSKSMNEMIKGYHQTTDSLINTKINDILPVLSSQPEPNIQEIKPEINNEPLLLNTIPKTSSGSNQP